MTSKAKPSQQSKFKQAARELETDDNEKRFNKRLGKTAKQRLGALKPPRATRKPA